MTDMLIVRHGQSEWNAAGRWQGQADSPLTPLGRAQARHAAANLPPVDFIAASSLERARATAEEMAAAVGVPDVMVHAGLMERDAGEFSGLTRAEIEEHFPGYLDNGVWPAGWEPSDQVVLRVRAALDTVAAAAGPTSTTLVVAHGGVIYALEGLFGLPHERIGNLGGRWFTLEDGALTIGERVHLLDPTEETVPDQL